MADGAPSIRLEDYSLGAGLERMLGNEVLERTMTDEAFLEQGASGGLVQEAGGQSGTGASW